MKDFDYTPNQADLQRRVREFAKKEVLPGAAARDRRAELPIDIFRRMGELGFVGIIVPPVPRHRLGCRFDCATLDLERGASPYAPGEVSIFPCTLVVSFPGRLLLLQ